MRNLSRSDLFGLAAALALLLLIWLNNAWVMLGVSAVGLVAGLWLARQGEVKRVAWVATVAFAVALAFAVFMLLR